MLTVMEARLVLCLSFHSPGHYSMDRKLFDNMIDDLMTDYVINQVINQATMYCLFCYYGSLICCFSLFIT